MPDLLDEVVFGMNAAPKRGVLHGQSPENIRWDMDTHFRMLQDHANNIVHNRKLTQQRAANLSEIGA